MKKLLIFLMLAIPLVIIVILNFTVNTVVGYVPISVDSIELDDDSVRGIVGESYKINSNIYPENATNKKIIWNSDNENVATVDEEGNVSFVSYGKCYITATTEDGNKKDSCYFYVYDTIAHNLDLYCENEEIEVGKSVQVKATVYPVETINKDVKYKSYDENIATIDANGFLTALKPGYVTVSATAVETGITSFLSIFVYKPVETLVITENQVVTDKMDYQIKYKTYPVDATLTDLSFQVSDPSIATVNKFGNVSFLRAGSVDITVSTFDNKIVKTLTITSTAGYVEEIYVKDPVINANLSDAPKYLELTTLPKEISLQDLQIISENPEICYVDENYYIQFISTGSSIIRIRGQKSENEFIEKTVLVYVSYPAEGIVLQECYYTGLNSFKLNPISYPDFSTNKEYFYHTQSNDITISEDGTITKIKEGIVEVEIDVYANYDYSDIHAKTKVIFTDEKPSSVILQNNNITIDAGQIYNPNFVVLPQGAINSDYSVVVLSQQPNVVGDTVVIIEDNVIFSINGGKADLVYTITLYNGETITQNLTIEVEQKAKEIIFEVDLDNDENFYITSLPTVNFNSYILPSDVTLNYINWAIKSGPASLHGNSIKFNSVGTCILEGQSQDKNVTKQVAIKYVGSNPIRATLSKIPEKIYVGDVFEIDVISTYPKNAIIRDVNYIITNQITTSTSSNKVLEIVGDKLKAVSGGTCTLAINIGTYQTYYDIEVIRLPQSLVINPSNIQTTKNVLSLTETVLPYDTTNKNVIYQVSDLEIATINNGILSFIKNGLVEITAYCEADNQVKFVFTVEKIDASTPSISPTNLDITLQVNEKSILDLYQFCQNFDSYTIEVEDGYDSEVIQISSGNIITAKNPGEIILNMMFLDKNGIIISYFKINITVVKLIEDFTILNQLDFYNGEYVTGNSIVELTSQIIPTDADKKNIEFEMVESFTSTGEKSNNIAYINENQINFLQSGILVLRAYTTDGGDLSKFARLRYTGGNAIGAELNITNSIVMEVGEKREIKVNKWIPYNTTNTQMFIEDISTNNVISISNNEIRAISGGLAQIRVELSSGITKYISIVVQKFAEDIQIENEDIIISSQNYKIKAQILPVDATNQTLSYELISGEVARLENNNLIFNSKGKAIVKISTTDGTDIAKTITITSTFGELQDFELVNNSMNLLKGAQNQITIKSWIPTDKILDKNQIKYEIIEQNPVLLNQQVISVSETGIITALNCGSSKIKVSYNNGNGQYVSKICEVIVSSIMEDFDIIFDREVDEIYGAKTIGKNNLGFSILPLPNDSLIKSSNITVSNSEIAQISQNKLVFSKAGQVDVLFEITDTTDRTLTKSITIYYTNGEIKYIEFDTSDFVGSVLNLNVGDKYEFKVKNYWPKDIELGEFSFIQRNENRNVEDLEVLTFDKNVITATHGGSIVFKIENSSFVSNAFSVNVHQKAQQIVLNTTEYTSEKFFKIQYDVLPVDAENKKVSFTSLNSEIAEVDDFGNVEFKKYGTVQVSLKLECDNSISRTINITYSNLVTKISFKNIPNQMFVRESFQLNIESEPKGCEEFEYAYSISDPTLAILTTSGKIIALDKKGQLVVRVEVVGRPEVYAEKIIEIDTIISDIELELDSNKDKQGIGEYRVWGNRWLKEGTNILTEKYQMKINSITPSDTTDELLWFSSNPNIATVDENGLLSFGNEFGDVTITVQPKKQASQNVELYLKDSYTFTVIKGLNVRNKDELGMAMSTKDTPAILQNNIKYENDCYQEVNDSIHGNGYLLDASFPGYAMGYNRLIVKKSNILIDNIQIRGASFDENSALSTLEGKGCPLYIATPEGSERITNVVIKNSIVENGNICIRVDGAEVSLEGCILRNSFSGGLVLSNNGVGVESIVTTKDCIFKSSMLSSILFEVRTEEKMSWANPKLIVKGDLKLMNWIDIDEFNGIGVEEYVGDAISQLKSNIKQNTQYVKYYNGHYYFMGGICAINAGVKGILSYSSTINVDLSEMSSKYSYVPFKIEGAVKVFGVPTNYSLSGYTLTSNNEQIQPGEKIEDDPNAYKSIKQPR